jgi:hypothetical protein
MECGTALVILLVGCAPSVTGSMLGLVVTDSPIGLQRSDGVVETDARDWLPQTCGSAQRARARNFQ